MYGDDDHDTSLERIGSGPILWVVNAAVGDGNAVVEVADWSEAVVVHMRDGLSASLRERVLARFPALKFYKETSDPHYAASEGFTDAGFAADFPLPRR